VNQINQVSTVSWSLPAPVYVSAPVYVDRPVATVQTIPVREPVPCALPVATLYGRPVEPQLYPVVVDGVVVDYQPLCYVYYSEPYLDCATAYYYYEPQSVFYCILPA
jgi:hypothetical protein